KQIAPVRMTGNYGSEIIRREPSLKARNAAAGLYHPEILSHVDRAKKTYAELRRDHSLSFIAFRQLPWYHCGIVALEETQVAMRSPFLDTELVRTAYRAPKSALNDGDIFAINEDCARLIAEGSPKLGTLRTDRGLGVASKSLGLALSREWLEFT